LKKGCYNLRAKTDSGMIKSQAVRGFNIPVTALFDEDENLSLLREILKAP